jgi:hypothetical protein
MTTEYSIYNSENKQLRTTILNTEPTVKLSKGNLRKFGTIGDEILPEEVLNELYKKSKKPAEEVYKLLYSRIKSEWKMSLNFI